MSEQRPKDWIDVARASEIAAEYGLGHISRPTFLEMIKRQPDEFKMYLAKRYYISEARFRYLMIHGEDPTKVGTAYTKKGKDDGAQEPSISRRK